MPVTAQQSDNSAAVIRQVDAAVKARIEDLAGYTDTEHYAVYRGKDAIHPVAEMTGITTYRKDSGKTYVIVSQTGSAVIRHLVLGAILEKEKRLNEPAIRGGVWITSANDDMTLKPGGPQCLDGRDCLVLTLRRPLTPSKAVKPSIIQENCQDLSHPGKLSSPQSSKSARNPHPHWLKMFSEPGIITPARPLQ